MNFATFTFFLPFFACAAQIVLGLLSLCLPAKVARFYGMTNSDAATVRLFLGGMPLFSGAFCLYWQSPSAFWSVGCGWFGLLLVRLAQWRSNPVCWRAATVEAGLVLSLMLGYFTH
jgi:hypothetical protein